MITKLLKHEFIRTRGILATVLGAATASIVLGCILMMLRIPVLDGFGVLLTLLPLMALIPAVQIILAVDFWRSSFQANGYLTHSIPVKGSTIFWTKLLWATIATAITLAVTFLLFCLTWFSLANTPAAEAMGISEPNPFAMMGALVQAASASVPMPVLIGVVVPLLLLALFFEWPVYYAFAATIGSAGRLGRMGFGGPVIAAISVWIAGQVIGFVCILAVPLGLDFAPLASGNTPEVITYSPINDLVNNVDREVMPLGVFLGMFVVLAACLVLSHRSWNKHVTLN